MRELSAAEDREKSKLKSVMPVLVRSSVATLTPEKFGKSYFYKIESGWEARVMERDDDICKALTAMDLERAFIKDNIHRILIPRGAPLSADFVKLICEKQAEGKTIYFESKRHG